jgi:glycerol-3-phosphate acyltransferase PlsY
VTAPGLVICAIAYLLGSIPFGLLLSRAVAGVDVRKVGSGNIGATNVARAAGKWPGALTLLLDVAKSALPILAARKALGPGHPGWVVAVGLSAFAGHLFPVYLRFRGGKGVATGFGVFLVLSPWAAAAGAATWGVAFAATRIASVASLSAAGVCVVVAWMMNGGQFPVAWAVTVVAMAVLLRHRGNIARLRSHRESRF